MASLQRRWRTTTASRVSAACRWVSRSSCLQRRYYGKDSTINSTTELAGLARDIARGAGAIIKDNFRASYSWRTKGEGKDLVTEVDERSEAYVIDRVIRESPEARILSEEAGIVGGDDARVIWIVDPLDGTRNFAQGIPFFCVSIGVVIDAVPEVGVIYDPIHDEMFSAIRGCGAICNGDPIHVSEETSIDDGLISVSWVRRKVDRGQYINYVERVSHHTSYFRRFGSAALAMAYVACGRTLAYLQGGLNPWDVAGGLVIVEEAGALITDLSGRPIDVLQPQIDLLTASPQVHSAVMSDVVRSA